MLRGVNVGGRNGIKMPELLVLYDSLGFKDAMSYIQSGNVVFSSDDPSPAALTKKIREKIKSSFGVDAAVLIRTGKEMEKAIGDNPFKHKDPGSLHVTFLSDAPGKTLREIDFAKDKSEEYSFGVKEIYLYLPGGLGRTNLSNDFFEKKLNVSATTRNWNTVNVLAGMAKEVS